MASSMKTWVYTDDQDGTFNRKVRTDYTTQMDDGNPKIGGALATAVHPPLPRSFRPRVALAQDATGKRYRIICFSADAALYATEGATFQVFAKNGGSAVTVTVYGQEGEKKRAKLLTP